MINAVYETIELAVDERGVATLTLARPDKHNAINGLMIEELHAAALALADTAAVRCVVLTGHGVSFCAGGDLGWMRDQMTSDGAARMAQALALSRMLTALDELPQLLIAKVHGSAYGGGVGLMAVCDLAIAASSANFALSETRLGLIPATIGPFIVRRIGEAGARAFMLHSKPFDAQTAKMLTLATHVVPADELDQAIAAEVTQCLQCAPGAITDAKALYQQLSRSPATDHSALSAQRLAQRWETAEAKAGINAFFAKMPPPWRQGD